MSNQTITIQGIHFTIDTADDGLVLAIGATPGEAACATIFVEVGQNGDVSALIWDSQAEAASAENNYVEPLRISLLQPARSACVKSTVLLPAG